MSRQERGTTKKCTKCGRTFTFMTLTGTKLVNGTECPSCEAGSRVTALLDKYHNRKV